MRPIALFFLTLTLVLAGCDLLPELSNSAPQVSISQPGENAVLTQGESVTVAAEASDSDGEVARVEFTFGNRSLGNAEQAPYNRTFTPEETGSFSLSARAFDDDDEASEPASVEVSVVPAPPNTFNVEVRVLGGGTVTSEPAGIDCSPTQTCAKNFSNGTTVVLTAQEDAGESFQGWGGNCSGTDDCTAAGDASVTATFTETEPEPSEGLEPFTLIALPDTQSYVCCDGRLGTPAIFTAQTQWIVDNLDDLDIAFVTHEGDVVDDASNEQEWLDGDAAMGLLDGRVPYSVAVGDHDYFPEEFHDGDTSLYREYFGESRYEDYDWYGGAGPAGLNHYQLFDGGGVEFLPTLPSSGKPPQQPWRGQKALLKSIPTCRPSLPPTLTYATVFKGGPLRPKRASTQTKLTPVTTPVTTKTLPAAKKSSKRSSTPTRRCLWS